MKSIAVADPTPLKLSQFKYCRRTAYLSEQQLKAISISSHSRLITYLSPRDPKLSPSPHDSPIQTFASPAIIISIILNHHFYPNKPTLTRSIPNSLTPPHPNPTETKQRTEKEKERNKKCPPTSASPPREAAAPRATCNATSHS